jgi:hypothetical protein
MALPEYVAPAALTIVGVPAVVWVVLRGFPHVARSLVLLLAATVAIFCKDDKRRESCHRVIQAVTGRDSEARPRALAQGQSREAPRSRTRPSTRSRAREAVPSSPVNAERHPDGHGLADLGAAEQLSTEVAAATPHSPPGPGYPAWRAARPRPRESSRSRGRPWKW